MPWYFHVILLPSTLYSSAWIVEAEAPLPVSNFATISPKGFIDTVSKYPHWVATECLFSGLAKCSITSLTIFFFVAFSIPSVPGEWFTSKIYGGSVFGFFEGIKSTAVHEPSIALAAKRHC